MQDILKLSASERILMAEAIWDSVTDKENLIELSDEDKLLLDERLNAHISNPEEGSSWDEVKKRTNKLL